MVRVESKNSILEIVMLKNKKKKIFVIPFIIILLRVLFLVFRILAFKVIIYPNWLTQSSDDISEIHIYSEYLDLEITDQKMMSKLYNLCKNTKIKHLEFDMSELNADYSEGFSMVFNYNNDTSDYIRCRTKDATVLKQPENALFWTQGEVDKELLSLLLDMESSNNSQIKAEQEQIFTEVKECLEEYEKDFDKIINLAKSDKSAHKEEISGYISLTEYSLNSNNSELEEQCISLMKKTKISDITFGQGYVSFLYEENQEYVTDITYFDDNDVNEEDLLWKVVKKIKPFYFALNSSKRHI